MKKLFVLILILFLAYPSQAQHVTIPDNAFLDALIKAGVDTDGDNLISHSEAETVSELVIFSEGISDLTGIESFINLEGLVCWDNQLTNLDVTNNSALTFLSCGENQLTRLDVTNNKALEWLDCFDNQLTSLDVSNNTSLTYLYCGRNQLSSLDISSCYDYFQQDSTHLKGSPDNLNVSDMPSLHQVCVWTEDFPPEGFDLVTTGSPNVTFTTDCSVINNINDQENNPIVVYPNPATDQLTLEFDPATSPASIRLFDISGKLVYFEIFDNPDRQTHTLNLSSLKKGLYLIRISNDRFSVTEKVIKIK